MRWCLAFARTYEVEWMHLRSDPGNFQPVGHIVCIINANLFIRGLYIYTHNLYNYAIHTMRE